MLRVVFFLILLTALGIGASGQNSDGVIENCPTLARLSASGQLAQIENPVFTDRASARRFAQDCAKVVSELQRIPGLPPEYQQLGGRAALAAEFLKGETYMLATSQVLSVVTLRKSVKIPPPAGFVYVLKYSSQESMPPVVRQAFVGLARTDNAHIQGVTIHGRYIALMRSDFRREMEDNLSHEMVHAYLTLSSKGRLPTWFQEAAAVYFSLGDDREYYNKKGDPRVIKNMRLPDDYKGNLHLFQYLEDKVGKEKLYEFIRQSLETGNPDARTALGLKPATPKTLPREIRIPVVPVVAAVIVIGAIVGWIAWQRRDNWDD